MNTAPLFKELKGLYQFQLDMNEIKYFDFNELEITQKLTLGSRVERFFEFYIIEVFAVIFFQGSK